MKCLTKSCKVDVPSYPEQSTAKGLKKERVRHGYEESGCVWRRNYPPSLCCLLSLHAHTQRHQPVGFPSMGVVKLNFNDLCY